MHSEQVIVLVSGHPGAGKSTILNGMKKIVGSDNWIFKSRDSYLKNYFSPRVKKIYDEKFRNHPPFNGRELIKPYTKENLRRLESGDPNYIDEVEVTKNEEVRKHTQPLFLEFIEKLIEDVNTGFREGKNVIVEISFTYDLEFFEWLRVFRGLPLIHVKIECKEKVLLEHIDIRNTNLNSDHTVNKSVLKRKIGRVHYISTNLSGEKLPKRICKEYDLVFRTDDKTSVDVVPQKFVELLVSYIPDFLESFNNMKEMDSKLQNAFERNYQIVYEDREHIATDTGNKLFHER